MTAARRRGAFVATIFASSLLLFLVQPMVARMALPRLGGTPAVWNSAMLVYQALLLGGYAYAHWLGRLAPRRQAGVHVALLALAMLWLPIGLAAMPLPADAEPALWVPYLLVVSIGPPFLVLSAQAPLLQRWFGAASDGADPYALYAASNLGSFAGLIAYPLLVEPRLGVHGQSLGWSAGYVAVGLAVAACALRLPRVAPAAIAQADADEPAPGPRRIAYWIALALVPSGLMLATTTYITTDILAMPLLWVIPLGLYLLSFSVAFAARRFLADTLTTVAPVTILLFGGVMMGGFQAKPYLNAALALMMLFMVAVALHTALYRYRPAPARLTGFYLAMSVGGALGGVFAGLLAPILFDWSWEYPLLVVAAGALVPQRPLAAALLALWRPGLVRFATTGVVLATLAVIMALAVKAGGAFAAAQVGPVYAVIAVVTVVAIGRRALYLAALVAALFAFGGYRSATMTLAGDQRVRSYFGVYAITDTPRVRQLAHGTTIHGMQLRGAGLERLPTTYYVPGSGVGQALLAAPGLYGPHARIGVVGLGTGTLACYARPGQDWRIFEIDPTVVRLARDDGRFTFLRRCLPGGRIVLGDARLRIAEQPAGSLDVLALDAFSSDAIPMHLMTAEAFAAYRRVLSPRGLLLVHISNRFMDLRPVVSAAAVAGGWQAAEASYRPGPLARDLAATGSIWLALSRDRATLLTLTRGRGWRAVRRYPGFTPWTDDYATILPLLKGY